MIGAGIGRTGTTSLKLALEQLGYGPCYHMDEVAKNPSHVPLWLNAVDGKSVDWDAIFDNYQAAVDLPTYPFYAELMAYYPASKVILTLRDPDEWYDSASQTIFRLPPPAIVKVLSMMSVFSRRLKTLTTIEPVARRIGYEYFFHNDVSRENATKVFAEHNNSVKQTVPPDRLLVYDVTQGWEPLCDFLSVPVPDAAFPHQNLREDFASRST